MSNIYHDIAFTNTVKALQTELGSRGAYAKAEGRPNDHDVLTEAEAGFISQRDSFYMASVGETGWPYIQHRGGPKGFVRVLDQKTIGFADFAGNRQFISLGNTKKDDRVSLFFMDYANRRRLKMFGRLETIEKDDDKVLSDLAVPGYRARIERGMVIHVEAFDWNCPQHITPRFTEEDVAGSVEQLLQRIASLEVQLEKATSAR